MLSQSLRPRLRNGAGVFRFDASGAAKKSGHEVTSANGFTDSEIIPALNDQTETASGNRQGRNMRGPLSSGAAARARGDIPTHRPTR